MCRYTSALHKGIIMAQKDYTVGGRQFRTESDYARALHDKKIIDELHKRTDWTNKAALEKLMGDIRNGKYRFLTLLGEDFREEIEEALKQTGRSSGKGRKQKTSKEKNRKSAKDAKKQENIKLSAEMNAYIQEELKRQEKHRRLGIALCSVVAVCCLGYFGVYSWFHFRTEDTYRELSELKNLPVAAEETPSVTGPLYTLDEQSEPREVLDEYKNLLNKNKRLIGWVKIDDTNIDYPVMQTSDNEYYLEHNLNQEYDKNGSIFMDKDCDVLKPSTNFIIYGHHMRSGQMFGTLDKYEKESYYEEHPYIQFDTIYEKGIYQIMYVFRSRVYSEDEIVFKYYQFIDANSEQEFNSYMAEMEAMSLYDTGVTAEYGDQLLTLSTCDYQEKNGRFVVVAKKIKE